MINTNKLKAYMVDNGYNMQKTAKELEVSVPTFSRKLNNKAEFTLSETLALCRLFNIKDPCVVFLPELSQMCNKKGKNNRNNVA